MNENEWVTSIVKLLNLHVEKSIKVYQGKELPYASEIIEYNNGLNSKPNFISYETDILITEETESTWTPRVVIECKINSVTTHDAITYSQKAFSHKNVHPHLRYGILIGNRKHYPLPGRLYRHGGFFDFMMSTKGVEITKDEVSTLIKLIKSEVEASKMLQEIIFNSRSSFREKYTLLHKPLILKR